MSSRWILLLALPLSLLAWGFLGQVMPASADETPSAHPDHTWLFPKRPVPEPEDSIIFSHSFHIDMGESCEGCHPNARTATARGQVTVPGKPECFNCHDDSDCSFCHTNADRPGARFVSSAKELIFSHADHMKADDATCASCHPQAATSEHVSDRLIPPMSSCTSCHQGMFDRLSCKPCHSDLSSLNMPPAEQAVHKPGFFALHGAWSKGQSALCGECHEQSYCGDCHSRTNPVRPSVAFPESVDRTFIHRGNFVERHALEARARPASCTTCHGQSHCNDCHTRALRQVPAPGVEGAAETRRSPHPPGYVTRGGEGFHGTDSRMNPQHCASCHDQGSASNCVACHQVGRVGGNPHPPGWNRRGGQQNRQTSQACIPCHQGM